MIELFAFEEATIHLLEQIAVQHTMSDAESAVRTSLANQLPPVTGYFHTAVVNHSL